MSDLIKPIARAFGSTIGTASNWRRVRYAKGRMVLRRSAIVARKPKYGEQTNARILGLRDARPPRERDIRVVLDNHSTHNPERDMAHAP